MLEQFNTTFIRGMSDGESGGPDKPDHSFDEALRDKLVGELTVHVDDDQTYRYRDASGDKMPIHVDDAFAKSVGLPGIIAHGLCTMAMCSQAVVKTVAGGDPSRLRRLAVRFSKPVLPGNDVVTTIYDIDEGGDIRPSSHQRGGIVIKDGPSRWPPGWPRRLAGVGSGRGDRPGEVDEATVGATFCRGEGVTASSSPRCSARRASG